MNLLAAITVWLALAGSAAGQDVVLYVDDDAPMGGDGSSWAQAFTFLQDALAETSLPKHDGMTVEIRLGQGRYKPNGCDTSAGCALAADAVFVVEDDLSLIGGYAGLGAPDEDALDPSLFVTTLSGDLAGDDDLDADGIPGNGSLSFDAYGDNADHVLDLRSATGVIDGLTITAGNAQSGIGGGIVASSSGGVIISRCRLVWNRAASVGAGAAFDDQDDVVVRDCYFEGNVVDMGGGAAIAQGHGGSLILERCTFIDNAPLLWEAGTISVFDQTDVGIVDCRILGGRGPSIATGNDGQPTPLTIDLVNTIVAGTDSHGLILGHDTVATVTNCSFVSNGLSAVTGSLDDTANVRNSVFWLNDGGDVVGPLTQNVASCEFVSDGESPLFVNAVGADGAIGSLDDDFRPWSDSDLVNAADPSFLTGITTDLAGLPRTVGIAPDIGPYESQLRTYIGGPGGSWFSPASWTSGSTSLPAGEDMLTIASQVIIDQPGAVAGYILLVDGSRLTLTSGATLDARYIRMDPGAEIVFEVDPSTARPEGIIALTGEIERSGNLVVTLAPSTTPVAGDSIMLIAAPSFQEAFVSTTIPPDPPGLAARLVQTVDGTRLVFYGDALYADASAPLGGDGASWDRAHRHLRETMLQAVDLAGHTTEIRVAGGTYKPDRTDFETSGTGDPLLTFDVPSGMSLKGGYLGRSNPNPDARNVDGFPTLLDGDLAGDDVPGFANHGENSANVVTSTTSAPIVIDGVHIRGGFSDKGPFGRGAGMYLASVPGSEMTASATIRNCTVRDCGGGSYGGGAQYFFIGGLIENCVFEDNSTSTSGGGVHIRESSVPVTIRNSQFLRNVSLSAGAPFTGGGGLGTSESVSILVEDCHFSANGQSAVGGGVLHVGNENLIVHRRCVFDSHVRGAAALTGGTGTVLFEACDFIANVAIMPALSIYDSSDVRVDRCRFVENQDIPGGSAGGTIHRGVLFTPCATGSLTVANSLFIGNSTSEFGGAIFSECPLTPITVANSTFVANDAANVGGGIYIDGDANLLTVSNCILWDNTDSSGGSTFDAQLTQSGPISATVAASIIEGAAGTCDTACGDDPMFRDPVGTDGVAGTIDDDLRVMLGSPAIEGGRDDLVPPDADDADGDGDTSEPLPFDADGFPRLFDNFDTPNPGPWIVDIGAYEFFANCDICPGVVTWIQPDGGDFSNDANWFPGTPNPVNAVRFEIGPESAYTVSLDQPAHQMDRLAFVAGDVTLDGNGGSTLDVAGSDPLETSILIGDVPGRTVTVRTVNGTDVLTETVALATVVGAEPALVEMDASAWTVDLGLDIGQAGTGELRLANNSFLFTSTVRLGTEPTANGVLTLDGAGTSLQAFLGIDVERGQLQLLNGASVVADVNVNDRGEFLGAGQLTGDLKNFGRAVIGDDPAVSATLDVSDNYEQGVPGFGSAVSGDLLVDLIAAGDADRLVTNDDAILGGGLFVDLAAGFTPKFGDAFEILNAATIVDVFDVAILPALPDGLFVEVQYVDNPTPLLGGGTSSVNLLVSNVDTLLLGGSPDVDVDGPPTALLIEDFDGIDGPDLAVTTATDGQPGSLIVFLNDGAGNLLVQPVQVTVGVGPVAIDAGRLTTDRVLDLAVANEDDDSVTILRGDGAGGFQFETTLTNAAAAPGGIAVADSDGDGFDDIGVTSSLEDLLRLHHNEGDDTFVQDAPLPTGDRPGTIDPVDDKRDGFVGYAVGNEDDDSLSYIESLGGGVFLSQVVFPVGDKPVDIAVGDLDGDGSSDLVTANEGDGTVSILIGEFPGPFAPAVNTTVANTVSAITAADLDGDGDLDLAVLADAGSPSAQVVFLRNDRSAEQLAFTVEVDPESTRNAILLAGGDIDQDMIDDIVTINDDSNDAFSGFGGGGRGGATLGSITRLCGGGTCPCAEDLDGDGATGFGDLILVLSAWGPCAGACSADLTGDGSVGFDDLLAVLSAWGPCGAGAATATG